MAKKKEQGIDKIKKKILAEADAEVKKIEDGAKQEVAKIQKRNKAEQKAFKRRYEERTAALVESYEQKTLAQARLDAKKSTLLEREAQIDSAIAAVIAKLDRMSESYERFLTAILDENKGYLSGKLTIACNKADVPLVGRLAKDAKVLADEDVTGGLILEDAKGKRVDESLDAVLGHKKDAIRQAVAALMR